MDTPMKKTAYSTAVTAIFLLPIFPLVVFPSLVVPFVTGQAFYFRILVEIAFAAWAVLAMLDARYRPKFTPLTIALGILVIVYLIADLVGVDPLQSLWSNFDRMEGWITIIHVFALYLVMKSLFISDAGKKLWHRWINFSLVISLIVTVYGLFQLFGWVDMHFGSSRIDASFGHPTFLAAYLLFQAFLAAYMFFDAWKDKDHSTFLLYVYAIIAALFAFDIFETGTRGTFLGLICGAAVALVTFSIFGERAQKKWRLICAGVIGLVVIFCAVFWLNRNAPIIQNNVILKRFASISWTASDQSRQYIWPTAVRGIEEKPLLGWGQENFSYLSQKYYDPAMYDREQWTDRAHNIFLDQAANSGLIGLLSYLAVLVCFLIAIRRSSLSFSNKCVLIGVLSGYIVHNMFVFDTLASYAFFFAMLALVDSLDKRKQTSWIERFSISEETAKFMLLPIAVVVLVASLYYFNIRPLQANIYLSMANDACSKPDADVALFSNAFSVSNAMSGQDMLGVLIPCTENIVSNPLASGSTKQSFIDLTIAEIKAQIADAPNNAYLYYSGGPFLKQIGKLSEAESLLNKAHMLAPNEQIISFELASVYLYEREPDKAVSVLKQAYESAPGYGEAASAYAVVLMIDGREADARQVFGADSSLIGSVKAYISSGQLAQATAAYQNLIAPPEDLNTLVQQARIQYSAGNTVEAVQILRSIEASRPQDKDQIEAAIKAVQP